MEDFKGFDGLAMFSSIANNAIRVQKQKPEDFVNAEGLLCCGICKELRQEYYQFDDKQRGRIVPVKITRSCRCEREEAKRKEEAEKYERDMRVIDKLKRASLMDAKFSGVTFDSLTTTQFNERNIKLCKRFAYHFDEMKQKNQGLMMWGGVGTGKSYAAAAIANYLLANKVPVVMTSLAKIVEDIQMRKLEITDFNETLSRADLVIFDDLGVERKTDFSLEIVYNAIDDRYRKKLPMIITSNNTLDQMKSEEDIRLVRIYDRLFEVCYPMQFTGPSWRKKMAFQKYGEMEALLGEGDEDPI